MRSSFYTVFLLLLFAFSHFGYAITDEESAADIFKRVENKGTLIVGTEGTYPPFTFYDESGKLTGYDIEVMRAVAKELGVQVEFRETQWDAMFAGLNSHRFDLIANQVGLTTPERRAKYDTTEPYDFSGAVVVARKEDNRVKRWEDIKGLKSAQSVTSNYGEKARKYGADIIAVEGLAQSLQLILQKRADITINDRLAVLDYKKKHPNAPIDIVASAEKSEQVGSKFVFNKGNAKTIEKFNAALQKLRSNGTLKQLSENFFGEDVSEE